MSDPDLLSVQDLCIGIPGKDAGPALVENVGFCLNRGEILGITGQSGSGKTLTAMALAGILPRPLAVRSGKIWFQGSPVLPEKGRGNFLVPGRDILMLFQSPSRALDPWVRIGVHLTDAVKAARKASGITRYEKPKEVAVRALEKTGLDAEVYDRYPFELSGGQRQRCLMALALAVKPRILIADEPATGQDDIHKSLVIKSIRELAENEGTAVILISHDLRGLQGLVRNLAVIYRGRQIEAGPARDMIQTPGHAHTRELVRAMRFMEGGGR